MHQEISTRITNSQTNQTERPQTNSKTKDPLSSADTSRRMGYQVRPQLSSEHGDWNQFSNF